MRKRDSGFIRPNRVTLFHERTMSEALVVILPTSTVTIPDARSILAMSVAELLDLIESHLARANDETAEGRAASAAVLRIGAGLAHRLGIHCPVFVAVICQGATASDWRTLFHRDPRPHRA